MKPSVKYCAKAGSKQVDFFDISYGCPSVSNSAVSPNEAGDTLSRRSAGKCLAFHFLSVNETQETYSCTVLQGCRRVLALLTVWFIATLLTILPSYDCLLRKIIKDLELSSLSFKDANILVLLVDRTNPVLSLGNLFNT
jgi:hypothetical protein